MRFEIVERQLDRLAGAKATHMVHEQIVIEGVRVIEISDLAIVEGKVF